MELQNINNSSISGLHNDNSSTALQRGSSVQKVDTIGNSAVNVAVSENSIEKRSSLSSNISCYLNDMSKIGSVRISLQTQVNTIDNIQDKMTQLVSGAANEQEIQPDVAQLISTYNSSVGSINDKMAKLDDLSGDSTTYFDGKAGAIPLGVDMINNEMSTRRNELHSTLEKISELNTKYQDKAQGVISTEVKQVAEASPFKAMDFGKESSDFNSTNMNNIAGSIASSQANAMQAQSVKLIS